MVPGEQLKFISLFAGIGGLDLGLERAGMQCVAQVEIEDYASKVLAKHWPNVARFRDVRECGAHNLPACDLICGGFPCQDISNAGRRAGLAGERSGLWFEFARIIGELRPRYALIENVSALLGRGLDTVLCDLTTLGYDAEWHCIPAAAVGAPHIRDRVFILAYANRAEWWPEPQGWHVTNRDDTGRKETSGRPTARRTNGRTPDVANPECRTTQLSGRSEELARAPGADQGERDQRQWDGDAARDSSQPLANAALQRRGSGRAGRPDPGSQRQPEQPLQNVPDADSQRRKEQHATIITEKPGWHSWRVAEAGRVWATEPDVGRVADGVPSRVDRLRGLGNAVVPQVAEFIGWAIVEHARASL